GGRAQVVRGESELAAAVANVQREIAAVRKMSFVPGVAGDVDPADRATPHDLADLDLAVLPGEFAVAENAAVWVTDRNLPARVVYFIPQHVVLVVPVAEIVPTMHAAYERLAERNNGAGEFATPAFGCYISGPSKTADIEQSLVIGAHGARSLTVLFCDRSGS
ncbi:MAG: LUD domain-containing protein, partial [Planctomycetales bacterium]|nr:LUD domain-containing protein [Planctomycetales bacterium]